MLLKRVVFVRSSGDSFSLAWGLILLNHGTLHLKRQRGAHVLTIVSPPSRADLNHVEQPWTDSLQGLETLAARI